MCSGNRPWTSLQPKLHLVGSLYNIVLEGLVSKTDICWSNGGKPQPIHGNGLAGKRQWSQPQRGAPTVFPSLIKSIKIFKETDGSYLADVRNGSGVLSISGKVVASLHGIFRNTQPGVQFINKENSTRSQDCSSPDCVMLWVTVIVQYSSALCLSSPPPLPLLPTNPHHHPL